MKIGQLRFYLKIVNEFIFYETLLACWKDTVKCIQNEKRVYTSVILSVQGSTATQARGLSGILYG